jgi:zona occludens toxin
MAIYLTTGKPGSFKTASTIEDGLKNIESGRMTYFCNFRGLKAQENGFNVLDHFNEWASIPDGSVLYVDEVQEFTRDVPTNAKTEELPEWFTQLEKHRHRGIDIYINTQHPMFIHTHLRRLIEKHIHLQRTQGLPFANKRQWGQVCNEPENIDNATLKKGCTTEIYRPKKSVFKYYESTVLDTHKFQLPTKFIKFFLLIGSLIAFALYMGLPVAQKYLNFSDKEVTDNQQKPNVVPYSQTDIDKLDAEQAQLAGMTLEQYRDLKNPEIKNAEHAAMNPEQNIPINYNPNNPYDVVYKASYVATTQPKFSGCIQYNGKFHAYTEQGTLIKDIDPSACKRLIVENDRPYNYFKEKQDDRFNTQINSQDTNQAITQRSIPQQAQIANNYVEPHLQARTVNGANAL